MSEAKEGRLRVWWIRNPPGKPKYCMVEGIDQAIRVLDNLARKDLKDDRISSNAGGLEVFEDGEWGEFYDEDGRDIDEIREEREAENEEEE